MKKVWLSVIFFVLGLLLAAFGWSVTESPDWQILLATGVTFSFFATMVGLTNYSSLRSFRKHFGIDPPKDWKEGTTMCPLVLAVLKGAAGKVRSARTVENLIMNEKGVTSVEELKRQLASLAAQRRAVEDADRELWATRNPARFFGFDLPDTLEKIEKLEKLEFAK